MPQTKTTPLEEAFKLASARPVFVNGQRVMTSSGKSVCSILKRLNEGNEWEYTSTENEANAALLVHCFNHFAELVDALERNMACNIINNRAVLVRKFGYTEAQAAAEVEEMRPIKLAREALAKAKNVTLPL